MLPTDTNAHLKNIQETRSQADDSKADAPHSTPIPAAQLRMLPAERKAALGLAFVYALRMFGLFMVLPVFALHAQHLPNGHNASAVGFSMGVYGLTQACMQLPMGWLSDRFGRKPVIVVGLMMFALGSIWGILADTLLQLTLARALQGAGAISAALTALLADCTRSQVRSKAMAMIGASIGLTFALSLVVAPSIYHAIGLQGLFAITGVLSVVAIGLVLFALPAGHTGIKGAELNDFSQREQAPLLGFLQVLRALKQTDLWRLNIGVLVLHAVQMALFAVLPGILLTTLHLPLTEHWQFYLPILVLSFACMLPLMIHAERHGKHKVVMLASVVLKTLVMIGFAMGANHHAWAVLVCMLAYFVAFNALEALQPSWVSRLTQPHERGAALGVYNTAQAFGLFAGGATGGSVQQWLGLQTMFWTLAILLLLWLWVALGTQTKPPVH